MNASPAVSVLGLSVIVKLVSANTANCVVALLPNNPVVPAIPLNVTLRSAGPTDRLLGTFKVPSAVPLAAVVNTALILVPTISTVIACCGTLSPVLSLNKICNETLSPRFVLSFREGCPRPSIDGLMNTNVVYPRLSKVVLSSDPM